MDAKKGWPRVKVIWKGERQETVKPQTWREMGTLNMTDKPSNRRDSSDSVCGLASIRLGSWAHLEDQPNGRGGIEWSRCGFELGWDPCQHPVCGMKALPSAFHSDRTLHLFVFTHWKQTKTIISLIDKSSKQSDTAFENKSGQFKNTVTFSLEMDIRF